MTTPPRRFAGYHIERDERLGEGGFLELRRVRVRVRRDDDSLSDVGLYDFVERPKGRDAVVVVLWTHVGGAVEVLLRVAPRLPLWFRDANAGAQLVELVAGIVEKGEDGWPALQRRAAAEIHEEAGLVVAPEAIEALGPAGYPSPGMFAERFVFVVAEVRDRTAAVEPPTDGSPFEEGASLEWLALDEALARCDRGQIVDLKTELGLRRLAQRLG